jgi:hypothetical protein
MKLLDVLQPPRNVARVAVEEEQRAAGVVGRDPPAVQTLAVFRVDVHCVVRKPVSVRRREQLG